MKFSIIIPMYNAAATIGRALESVKKQKYTDYEVIVVDDGSDEDCELPDAMNGVYVYQRNQGAGAARNRGLMNAKGEYVMFLDADDELFNEWAITAFANVVDGHDAVYGGIREAGNGYVTYRSAKDMGSVCGAAYRRDFLLANGIWFPELPQMEDVVFNQLVECCGARIFNDTALTAYTYHVDGDRAGKERYKITALEWIVRANMWLWGKLRNRDINLAYTQTVKQVGFIYWYLMGAMRQMTQQEYVDFWGALVEWEQTTGTLKTIKTVNAFADFYVKCEPGNKRSAESIVRSAEPAFTQKEFFEMILGNAGAGGA